MATTIQSKRTTVAGREPTNLEEGEIALDIEEGKLYYGADNNQIGLLTQATYVSLSVDIPPFPKHKATWFQTDTQHLYFYDDTQPVDKWVKLTTRTRSDGEVEYPFYIENGGVKYIDIGEQAVRDYEDNIGDGISLYDQALNVNGDGIHIHTPLISTEAMYGLNAGFSDRITIDVDPPAGHSGDRVPTTRWVQEAMAEVNDPNNYFEVGTREENYPKSDVLWEHNKISGRITNMGKYTGLRYYNDNVEIRFGKDFTSKSTIHITLGIEGPEYGSAGKLPLPCHVVQGSIEKDRFSIGIPGDTNDAGLDNAKLVWVATGW